MSEVYVADEYVYIKHWLLGQIEGRIIWAIGSTQEKIKPKYLVVTLDSVNPGNYNINMTENIIGRIPYAQTSVGKLVYDEIFDLSSKELND